MDIYRISDNTLVQSYSQVVTEADEENDIETRTDVTETHFGATYSSVIKDKSVSYTTGNNTVEYGYTENDNTIISDSVKYNNSNVLSSSYTYDNNGNITVKDYGNSRSVINTYDAESRISSTSYNNKTYNYTYDANSQLTAVSSTNYSASYAYDNRGNIANKTVNGTATTFSYSNDGWSDKLKSVNGTALTYDANGNLLTFGDKSFTWSSGRNLAQITDGNNTYSYTYDENGIRTSKTVNGVTTYYNTKDGIILSQTDGTNTMYFQYDTSGTPLGFIYNGTQYFYMTNQMGDVIAITDTNGTIVGNYEYDAWGTVTLSDSDIANINPLRYRGYYYDLETECYYLQSRYYDTSICRFINADEYNYIDKDIVHRLNLFTYCSNNSINKSDSTGCWSYDVHSGFNTRTWTNLYEFKNSSENYGTYYWAQRVGFSDNFAYFIGYWCNYVDTKYDPMKPSQANNSWHFNSNWYTGYKYDTRDTHSNDMIKKAKQELNSANSYYKKNNSKYKNCLRNALIYIGYSLHPIQDKYSHKHSVSHLLIGSRKNNIVYYHYPNAGVDDANKHVKAVNNAGTATKNILKTLYNNYSLLRRKDLKFYVK